MGMEVLGPDLNESSWHYLGREGRLRVGLMAIAGLRRETAARLLDDRESVAPSLPLRIYRRGSLSRPRTVRRWSPAAPWIP
jgi:DNA polymerase III alpha subunit